MGRLKTGSRLAHFSMINDGVTSTWITAHYNQLLDTRLDNQDDLETEASVTMTTEDSLDLQSEEYTTSLEITTIPFVADESKEVDEDLP